MELRQLAHFVAVAEELHFTRAATRVHVVQSSLSSSIGALERELGEALFVRDNRRVVLTQAGRALLPAARRALAAADEGRDAVAGVRGVLHGQLHVGAIQTLGVVDLAALLATFRRAHPGVTIRLSHGAASALARAAADAELDIAFIDGPVNPARLTRTELGRDYLVLAIPRGDPLARRDSIRLDDPVLRDRDFVEYRADSALRAQIDAACAAAGLARRVACEVENMQYLVESVQHGLGVTVLPPMAIQPAGGLVAAVPITPPLHRDLSAVVAAGRPATGAAQALLALLPAGYARPGLSQPWDTSMTPCGYRARGGAARQPPAQMGVLPADPQDQRDCCGGNRKQRDEPGGLSLPWFRLFCGRSAWFRRFGAQLPARPRCVIAGPLSSRTPVLGGGLAVFGAPGVPHLGRVIRAL